MKTTYEMLKFQKKGRNFFFVHTFFLRLQKKFF
jgi:hypothetical protein